MNELKLCIEALSAFEAKLRALGGSMKEAVWIANWYLETTEKTVLKVMQVNGAYRLKTSTTRRAWIPHRNRMRPSRKPPECGFRKIPT